jgi:hypothetical protein
VLKATFSADAKVRGVNLGADFLYTDVLSAPSFTDLRVRRVGTLPLAVLDDARSLLASTDDDRQANWTSTRTDLVRDFVGRFLDYHLETRLKSQRAFLAVKNRNAPADTNG